jgi:hypothetical protein
LLQLGLATMNLMCLEHSFWNLMRRRGIVYHEQVLMHFRWRRATAKLGDMVDGVELGGLRQLRR